MKIVILKTWLTNIGNGFIDKGAVEIARRAFPEATIIEVSGYSNFVADQKSRLRRFTDPLLSWFGVATEKRKRLDHPLRNNIVDISQFVDPDLVIFPGCVLYEWAMRKYWRTLKRFSDNNVPIVFLGAGGGDYSKSTQDYMRNRLSELDPVGLISRDLTAYNLYSDEFSFAHNGIDCAFFIDDWYTPATADKNFAALTFDKSEEPDNIESSSIVRPHHYDPLQGIEGLKRFLPFSSVDPEGTFYSDSVEDYLFIYANAEEVHSDRIHACIPSLVYGTPAKFYFDTPRADLFDNIEIQYDSEGFMNLTESIREKKQSQVNTLKKAVKELD